MKTIKLYIIIALNLFVLPAMAQQDTLRDGLNVSVRYVPTLSESIKIPVNPNPEQPKSTKPTFNYMVPDLNTSIEPTIYTIKPISLGTMLLPKLKNNYMRLGFGNYLTPLAEIYYNSVRNKTWNNGIFYKHLSSTGDRDYNNFSNNTIGMHTKRMFDKSVLSASALYYRNAIYNYGYPDGLPVKEDTLKNIYNLFDINISLENLKADTASLNYKVDVNYYNISNSYDLTEHNFKLGGNFSKAISDIPFQLYTAINSISNINNGTSLQRSTFTFNPRINIGDDNFYIKAGFNYSLFADSTDAKNYFYPVAEAAYHLIPSKLTVLGGVTGNLQVNTMRSITTENPFVRYPSYQNTNNKFEMYVGLKGNFADNFNYALHASIANVDNLLFYIQDTFNRQKTIYDNGNVTLTTLSADVSYQVGEKWRLGLVSKYYGYSMSKLANPYSRPSTETKLNTTYNLGDKFLLRADIFYVGERTGGLSNPNAGNQDAVSKIKLDPFVDLNMGIDYRYNKSISIFINLNNMAAARYKRWTNYDVYGFNGLAGVTLVF
ncbi:MAG: hypothetical protein V4643_09175 [Bacteroidota bacterium]